MFTLLHIAFCSILVPTHSPVVWYVISFVRFRFVSLIWPSLLCCQSQHFHFISLVIRHLLRSVTLLSHFDAFHTGDSPFFFIPTLCPSHVKLRFSANLFWILSFYRYIPFVLIESMMIICRISSYAFFRSSSFSLFIIVYGLSGGRTVLYHSGCQSVARAFSHIALATVFQTWSAILNFC